MSTLFYDTKTVIDSLLFTKSLLASKEFIDCADKQLTSQFITQTGLRPSKHVCFSLSNHYIGAPIYSEYIIPNTNYIGRKLCINLYVNHNWNPITIYWKSKKGLDYKLHDINIDCEDILFWFEKLDTELYIKQLYPKQILPFKTLNFPFDLKVVRLNIDSTMTLILKSDIDTDSNTIIEGISNFINKYNEISESKDKKYGVIHNFKTRLEGLQIAYDFDLGSAGMHFIKGILKYLAKINFFESVEFS